MTMSKAALKIFWDSNSPIIWADKIQVIQASYQHKESWEIWSFSCICGYGGVMFENLKKKKSEPLARNAVTQSTEVQ